MTSLSNERLLKHSLIVSITPYFLEKGFVWFEENLREVLNARKTQNFWQDNTLYLKENESINLHEILRKLDEMGYEKVFKISEQGEFAHKGGVVEVFPVNTMHAVRLDFLGNKIETIEKLALSVEDEKAATKLLKKKLRSQKMFSDLKGLKEGNYLVHLDHGIGRFAGIKEIPTKPNMQGVQGVELLAKKECKESNSLQYYVLEYAEGDKLYVPKGLERKLSRYVGFREPVLSRLSSSLWQKTKRKIKQDAEKFAKELLEMFAKKETTEREPYTRKEIADSLAVTFEHTLTPDQKQAINEINKDMEEKKPMDRIVCGDVGFGKTEVALRATVRAVENGRQAAMIAPTTILASQHFETFQKRLKDLPIKVGLLCRLQNQDKRKKIVADLAKGKIDILIGTHSILSRKVAFQNLGLLIIDDEQRFGVAQKEKLRTLKPELDVLLMSATPIPRTLYMALSSLKEVSLIQTPPEGRKGIKTYVLPFKKEIIEKAIKKELSRDGQIYFLHNRVETISIFKKFLEELGTGAKIGILHAKLPEKEIVRVLSEFKKKKIDLLLATTIIENGLDIANVNTLIVDNSTKLGLAQAYQLRGRIGRSRTQAFAYFLYPKRQLKGLSKKRLTALKEAEELGSGYRIAVADLEIRGAGNILGREQSGSVNRVGLNLYCQMLSQSIEKLKLNRRNTSKQDATPYPYPF